MGSEDHCTRGVIQDNNGFTFNINVSSNVRNTNASEARANTPQRVSHNKCFVYLPSTDCIFEIISVFNIKKLEIMHI